MLIHIATRLGGFMIRWFPRCGGEISTRHRVHVSSASSSRWSGRGGRYICRAATSPCHCDRSVADCQHWFAPWQWVVGPRWRARDVMVTLLHVLGRLPVVIDVTARLSFWSNLDTNTRDNRLIDDPTFISTIHIQGHVAAVPPDNEDNAGRRLSAVRGGILIPWSYHLSFLMWW